MKIIASRQLAAKPGAVWSMLADEGPVVVTKDGVPRCIMLSTTPDTLLEDAQDAVFARARRAVSAIRAEAARSGISRMSFDEIDREIRSARLERKRK